MPVDLDIELGSGHRLIIGETVEIDAERLTLGDGDKLEIAALGYEARGDR